MRLAVRVAFVAAVTALAVGCAQGDSGIPGAEDIGGASGTSSTSGATPSPAVTTAPSQDITPSGGTVGDATAPGKGNAPSPKPPAGGEVTVTGEVVFRGIEGGCLVLEANGEQYELMGGDRRILTAGARVTVRGRVRTDVFTICQIGPVLEVLEARPA